MSEAANGGTGLRIAFGPELPGWGSWTWVGADLAGALAPHAQVSTFSGWAEQDADVVVVVKHAPPQDWAERAARRAALVYCPVDFYDSAEAIRADANVLRHCARIVVHCERLRPHFAPFAPVEYLDHHVKFAAPLRKVFQPGGNLLWVGVRSNLEPLVEWVNAHPLPAPLDVLTNLERSDSSTDPAAFGFRAGVPVTVHHWSPEKQEAMTAAARAALDVKGDDFRSRHKPPAKAIDFVVSGVPLALNPGTSPAEHLASLGLQVADPLDADRWLSREYWAETSCLGARLRRALTVEKVAARFLQICTDAYGGRQAATASSPPSRLTDGATDDRPMKKPMPKKSKQTNTHKTIKAKAKRPEPKSQPTVVSTPSLKLYGLLITKDDHDVFGDWCRDQLPLYDAVVCLDGSAGDATARLAAQFSDRLIYLNERDYTIPHKTDHGLRRIAHNEIVARFGPGRWVMCCHVDEYCYHDPRKVALRAEREGYDQVSWFSPHFYPHPDDLADWDARRLLPLADRFQHYHWDHFGAGTPWVEDRLYRAAPGVEWDGRTHMNVRPLGLKRSAPFRPTYRHFKVIVADPAWYEREERCAHYRHHWVGQEDRTGLPFPVRHFTDLFVRSIPKYERCDRFDGAFDQPWNVGDHLRATATPAGTPDERQRHHARDLAIAGSFEDAVKLLSALDRPDLPTATRAALQSDLAAVAAARGDATAARAGFAAALALDPDCASARANLAALESLPVAPATPAPARPAIPPPSAEAAPIRVAVVSLLFNWPSTGGGNVHTAELTRFLAEAGYAVRHFHVRFPPWGIGEVTAPTPFPSEALAFTETEWNARAVQDRVRRAVAAFDPDCVILTDSWNFKPLLAEAVREFPYILRMQALECLCPLNNVRLLPEPGGRVRQCHRHQLATPDECLKCVQQRGDRSGSLHQAERALSGVGTPGYTETLRRAFAEAEAVLVVNPLTEAMVSPYARDVRVVTAGMDPARFPWPAPDVPANGKKKILFAGLAFEWMKGFHVLREAAARLWTKRQDFEVVATSDPLEDAAPFERFIGWQSQEDLPKHLWACDVLAMPTVAQEALGRTAVEAMASGRPVVASRLGGLPFTVADGATGLLAEPGDAADLAAKLETLLDDAALRERLGRAGRRRFEEHYAWPVIVERHYRPLLIRRVRKTGGGGP